MTGSATLDELKKAVIDQKKAALPLDAADPALEEVHRAVLRYDAQVSQLVIGLIQQINLPLPEEDLQRAEQQASTALENAQAHGTQRYKSYKARLDHLRALAEQIQQEK